MDAYETSALHNLAETCCASISLAELQELSGADTPLSCVDTKRPLTYGHITGSPALRRNLARQYLSASITEDNVLITAGAIQANFLSLYSLIGAGDHVICQYPTYQQLYSVPEALGAEVTLWKSDPTKGWSLQIDDLKSMVKANTKMIIIKYVVHHAVLYEQC
jgi:aspartate/methionine/tyrosine aminotransferase